MYIKNSVNRIAIGPVVKISDGVVQTADVLIRLLPEGGAAAAGTGTVGYQDGIVTYVPAAGEMDYASVVIIAHKADCIPAAVTVTTAAGDPHPIVNHVDHGNAALRARGDVAWVTGNTVVPDAAGTANTLITALASYGDTHWSTASGFATPTNVTDARDAIITQGNSAWVTGNTITPPSVGDIASQVRTELTTELGRIDAAISTRSTYDGSDTAGTTTLLTRVVGTLAAGTHVAQTGDTFARLGAPAGASVSADVAGVKTVADALNGRLSDQWAGRVACIVIGNVSGARTAAEVFTYGGVTGTVSADADGNRTIVFS